ncbi:MAG: site-specific integrase [Nocardioidaceae bacterium]
MARRQHGDGSIYQRHDHPSCPPPVSGPVGEDGKPRRRPEHRCRGHWVAVVNLGWAGGRRPRKTLYGKTRKEVAQKLARTQKDQLLGALVAGTVTVEQWMTYWLDHIAAPRCKLTTMKSYRSKVKVQINPGLGRHRLDKLEPQHLRALYARMREPCPDGFGVRQCPHRPTHGHQESMLRQTHAILRRALTDALRDGKVARNVATLLDAPSTHVNHRTPLTVDQARAVIATADGTRLASRWYAALYLGVRQAEALGLTWENLDLDGMLYVLDTTHGDPKSRAGRRGIPVPPFILATLRARWVDYLTERQAPGYRDHGLVWAQADGRPIGAKADWTAWRDLLASAGVPHVALHAARNTTGSLLDAAGVSARLVAEILGHAQVQLAQNVYIRGDLEGRRAAMAALESLVQEKPELEP